MFNQEHVFKSMKDSCFTAEYDIVTKNKAHEKVREADNVRLTADEIEKRLKEERDFNMQCRME